MATTWKDVPQDVVLKCADLCDGHSIFHQKAFTDFGAPPELVPTDIFESDTSKYVGTIYDPDSGKPVGAAEGVPGLDLLYRIATDLNLTYDRFSGRGRQARAIQDAIHRHFSAVNSSG